jgi:peptidoglycan/xylan/chitin deacetylase (PgdA/CDA1 family)
VSLRHHLHILLAEVLYYSGLLAAWRFLRTRILRIDQTCVLGFHRILPEAEFAQSNALPGMMMKENTFVSLLEFVTRRFTPIALDELGTANRRGPYCAFTFDDGWKDNYSYAYRWMKQRGVPATIFLVTGFIGGEGGFWVERLIAAWKNPAARQKIQASCSAGLQAGTSSSFQAGTPLPARPNAACRPEGRRYKASSAASLENVIESLKRMPSPQRAQLLEGLLPAGGGSADRMLSWDEVTEMSQAGIGFGAHTVTHPLLPYEDGATAEREISGAKLMLEERLQKRVRAFAYPNGDWDAQTRQLVAAAGYDWAFTTRHGWYRRGRDPFTVPRVLLHEGNVTGRRGQFSPAMFTLTTVVSG